MSCPDIDGFVYACRFQAKGCQNETLKGANELIEHETKMCNYRPRPCPFCDKWFEMIEELPHHLLTDHKTTKVDPPFRTKLDWTFDVVLQPKMNADDTGRRWSILFHMIDKDKPLEEKKRPYVLLFCDQDIDDKTGEFGDFHFQTILLGRDQKFTVAIKYQGTENQYQGLWVWKMRTAFEERKSIVVLPKQILKGLQENGHGSKIVKISLSINDSQ